MRQIELSKDKEIRVFTASAELFLRLGYRGTTTRMIARAAGIGEVTLFRWFSTKEYLYRQILQRAVDEITRWSNQPSRREAGQALPERASDWIGENREPLQLLYVGLFDQPEIAGPLLNKCIDAFVNAGADSATEALHDKTSNALKRKVLVGAMLAIAAHDRFLSRVFLNSEPRLGHVLSKNR